jgi:hypothetical protein
MRFARVGGGPTNRHGITVISGFSNTAKKPSLIVRRLGLVEAWASPARLRFDGERLRLGLGQRKFWKRFRS